MRKKKVETKVWLPVQHWELRKGDQVRFLYRRWKENTPQRDGVVNDFIGGCINIRHEPPLRDRRGKTKEFSSYHPEYIYNLQRFDYADPYAEIGKRVASLLKTVFGG